MLHQYVCNSPGSVRYGTSGRPVPGYEIRLVDEQGTDVGEDRNKVGTYRPDVNRPSSRATIFNVLILRTDLVLRTHRSPAS
jgi:acyl-coenzyme A synthetase/AMP-(fatty) acid ligase